MKSILFLSVVFFLAPTLAATINNANEETLYLLKSNWKNQNGQSVSLENLKGAPRVLTMIFTRCPEACPMIVSDLKRIEKKLKHAVKEKIRFTLFSFDYKRDTPATLLEFAKKMKLDANWDLLVSDSRTTRELAALLDIQYKELANGDFVHSTVLIAVDSDGRPVARRFEFTEPLTQIIDALNKLPGAVTRD